MSKDKKLLILEINLKEEKNSQRIRDIQKLISTTNIKIRNLKLRLTDYKYTLEDLKRVRDTKL